MPGNPPNPEAGYLRPTPHGELCDVALSTATGAFMGRYPVVLLAGDIDFTPAFLRELETAVASGSRLLLHPRHVAAIPAGAMSRLRKGGTVEVLTEWRSPRTGRPAAIPDERLARIAAETLPVAVEGDPVQFQVNRSRAGWVVELIHNDGVVKTGRAPAEVYPEVIARVRLRPRFASVGAREWITGAKQDGDGAFDVAIPPGESRYVEFNAP